MQTFKLQEVSEIVSGTLVGNGELEFSKIVTDSRNIINPSSCLFVAVVGEQHDGHNYIDDIYRSGVRAFLVSKDIDTAKYAGISYVKVANTLEAMQKIATYKRLRFNIPVIGITGSNGKTIVKEWLHYLLSPYFNITRSPKSYNSQIGVPLSVWLLEKDTELAIFEAGISQPGEMESLEKIIRPTIGILTNIGSAHQSNFESREQKIDEKLKLFEHCDTIIYNCDDEYVHSKIINSGIGRNRITWSEKGNGTINLLEKSFQNGKNNIILQTKRDTYMINIPFGDDGSIQNCITCFCVMYLFNKLDSQTIFKQFRSLPGIKMRLETLDGINNSILINDSYNSDINSLEIALDYLNQKKSNRESLVIMSDILQNNTDEVNLYREVAKLLKTKQVDKFIGIGKSIIHNKNLFPANSVFFQNTDSFIKAFSTLDFDRKAILLKGARVFQFEKVSKKLQNQTHESVIETDLSLMKQNLQFFQSKLAPGTKLTVMVKAFAYGIGSLEIANFLQRNKVDYLAVAIADEGVELRNSGIKTPIIVMNPNINSLQNMIEYGLEPEIYSLSLLRKFIKELKRTNTQHFPIHIKLDTGMHRLGLNYDDLDDFCAEAVSTDCIKITSVFSHLVGSDDPALDYFTEEQVSRFGKMYDRICELTGSRPMRHILNSAGIIRFPQYDFEMVRLGIGLHGLMPHITDALTPVTTFKSIISQIHRVPAGETVSYNRKGKLDHDALIATIPVGYADGIDRHLGNGNWYFMVNGKKAPIIGNVCMDMCMIDITGIDAEERDEVVIFGKDNPICDMAKVLGTIPYEILTSIPHRIKRVYFEE
ncbi:MAG: bifunctional UDP-N-acetylmuramoyl-tripeptide:D-alanyl-D-alanine ligase/alanine racemase [Bacteroidales bacterium]|nr:bifunctional UDP-N-acetylmuramoyl-tripeptide:D-alanyl-D-alanine ligase/alanine racemase [Bacteroidales bacterium]